MGTVSQYHDMICKVMKEYAYPPSHGQIEVEFIIDSQKGHYEIMHIGWDGSRRVHGSILHIDVIDDKVWVQHDGTSPGVALDLVAAGIPKEAIVLGFRPEHVRPYTGFAVG